MPGESHRQRSLWETVHRVTKNWTQLKQLNMHRVLSRTWCINCITLKERPRSEPGWASPAHLGGRRSGEDGGHGVGSQVAHAPAPLEARGGEVLAAQVLVAAGHPVLTAHVPQPGLQPGAILQREPARGARSVMSGPTPAPRQPRAGAHPESLECQTSAYPGRESGHASQPSCVCVSSSVLCVCVSRSVLSDSLQPHEL